MNEMWHIQADNGEQKTLTDLTLVSRYEKELKDQGVKYKTDYYEDGKLITLR